MAWEPQPGPQTSALLADWCFELFYGGERGGGKSDFQLGYQEDGALRYGKAWRGIMFRKTYPELEELQGRALEVFPATGGVFKSQPSADYPFSNCWYWPSGATVKMRYIERERDYGRYHGHSYCVGVGTPVLMADGSYRAIESIKRGEFVQTLEGAREVTAITPPYIAPCVEIKTNKGAQVMPVWHPVLASEEGSCELRRDGFQTGGQPPLLNALWQSAESLLGIDRNTLAFGAYPEDDRSARKGFDGIRREFERRGQLSCRVMLVSRHYLKARGRFAILRRGHRKFGEWFSGKFPIFRPLLREDFAQAQEPFSPILGRLDSVLSAALYARVACVLLATAKAVNFLFGCLAYRRLGGGLLHQVAEADRYGAPSLTDVGEPDHGENHKDGKGCIPEYSRRVLYRYIHPYTKEPRDGVIPLESGTAQITWHGDAWVADLTVASSNHYITKCGLINKNTGISADEVTEYETPAGILKMLSTLRSPEGVPCSIRLTGNPGGVGHAWVKARYIDVAPPYTPVEIDGNTRMFIPSRTSDNAILLKNDPRYRDRIRAATAGNEALAKAWLEGDWDIVAGAYFTEWDRNRHVIEPFNVPKHWLRFRSFDWGSSAPFSVGWWTISDGTELPDGRIYPSGAMIRYREWYGATLGADGIARGLEMMADEVARGILERESHEKITYGVADPACWITSGGPSIAETMLRCGVVMHKADNRRIPGWQQMRMRLRGDSWPMLYVFNTCRDTIRTLPLMQHDEKDVEDLDTRGEDHAVDDIRYACMSRPWTVEAAKNEPPKFGAQTFNELRDMAAKARRERA